MPETPDAAQAPDAVAVRRLLTALAVTRANTTTICAALDAWRLSRPSPYLMSGPHLYIEAIQRFELGVWDTLARAYAHYLRDRGRTISDAAVLRAWGRIRRGRARRRCVDAGRRPAHGR